MEQINNEIKNLINSKYTNAQAQLQELLNQLQVDVTYGLSWTVENMVFYDLYSKELNGFIKSPVLTEHKNADKLRSHIGTIVTHYAKALLRDEAPKSTSDFEIIKYRARRQVNKRMVFSCLELNQLYKTHFAAQAIPTELEQLLNTV